MAPPISRVQLIAAASLASGTIQNGGSSVRSQAMIAVSWA
jgi:hypothetical protein